MRLPAPPALVAEVGQARAIVLELHRALLAHYRARGLEVPPWRDWPALVARWPFLEGAPEPAPAAPAAPAARMFTAVHVLRPLPAAWEGRPDR